MSTSLPPEIEVTELPDGAHYRLPRRKLGWLHLVGFVPIGMGVFGPGCAIYWIVRAVVPGGLDCLGLGLALFWVPFLLAGLWLLRLGIVVLAGHSEIKVSAGRLHAIERAGPIRWTRRCSVNQVSRLVVRGAEVNDKPVTSGPFATLGAIQADCSRSKKLLLAPAYPRDWLKPLADDVARRCRLASLESPERPVTVVVETSDNKEAAAVLDKPPGSTIELNEHADGITVEVPPAGLWRGSGGLFVFSLIWNGFMTVFSGFFVYGMFFGDARMDVGGMALFVLVIVVFWAVGTGMFLAAVNMGRRRAVLGVVGRRSLLVLQTGIFGAKRHEWDRDQIADIRAGPSGMTMNDVPVIELQIVPTTGKKFGLLAGRDKDELYWLAQVLRRALPPAAAQQTEAEYLPT